MQKTVLNKIIQKNNKHISLNLLKVKALKAAFNVDTLVVQKLISKKEVKPINSHPKNIDIILPELTKKIMLITNIFKKINKRSICGSNLKYEKA